jgi:serpin B
MKLRLTLLLAALLVAAAASYYLAVRSGAVSAEPQRRLSPVPRADDTGATEASIAAIVQGNNDFAVAMFHNLRAQPGNLFFSPYSITAAVGMVHEGARGQTASEMRKVFGLSENELERQPAFAALHNRLNPTGAEFDLRVANSLWAQQGHPFLPAYVALLKSRFAASASNVDFAANTEAARQQINRWTADQTEQKIPELFQPGQLKSLTRLALVNAIYFKGKWFEEFDPGDTKDEDFFTTDGPVKVPMMQLSEDFNYLATESYKALKMSYQFDFEEQQGSRPAMYVLLPKAQDGLDELEAKLDPALLTELFTKLSDYSTDGEVEVFFPRFEFRARYGLNGPLAKLGMPTAFDERAADLTGMDGGAGGLYIGTAIHEAYVKVDEKGTEAAAATGMAVDAAAAPDAIEPRVFRADHPFLFLIRDDASGAILFLGRMANPNLS